jgi:prophage maintenance system killer protein
MIMLNKKIKQQEYEAKVVRRKQGIENARDERELRESQDQRQNSFVSEFESGELVH